MNSVKLRAISLSQASLSGILRQKIPMNGMSSAASVEKAKEKLGSIMSTYEQYTGIAEVTAAQNRVLEVSTKHAMFAVFGSDYLSMSVYCLTLAASEIHDYSW